MRCTGVIDVIITCRYIGGVHSANKDWVKIRKFVCHGYSRISTNICSFSSQVCICKHIYDL